VLEGSVAVGSVGSLLGEVLSGDDGDDGGMLESGLPGELLAGSEVDGSDVEGIELEELLLDELVSPEVDVSLDEALPVLLVSVAPAAEAERERSQ
jgi:hypothetical protein